MNENNMNCEMKSNLSFERVFSRDSGISFKTSIVQKFCPICSNKFKKTYSDSSVLVSISPTFYEQFFAPKSFCQKITNPNFKHIKAAQRALV